MARNYTEAARMFLEGGGNVRTEFTPPELFVKPVREMLQQGKA